eukprot:1532877-Rhodomonas_salina.1
MRRRAEAKTGQTASIRPTTPLASAPPSLPTFLPTPTPIPTPTALLSAPPSPSLCPIPSCDRRAGAARREEEG